MQFFFCSCNDHFTIPLLSLQIILIQRTVRRWLKTKHFFRARRALWAGRHDSESQEEDLDLPEGDEGEGDEEDKAPDSHKDSDKVRGGKQNSLQFPVFLSSRRGKGEKNRIKFERWGKKIAKT